MAKLVLLLLIVCIVCGIVLTPNRQGRRQRQQFVVEEGVYQDNAVGTATPPQPPPPKQCPEMRKLESLVGLFDTTQNWALLVEVGGIYARGCFPFYGADADTACRIFQLASRCPDLAVAARAMSRFADTRLHPISPKDSVGEPFPPGPAKKLCAHAEYHIERCHKTFNRPKRHPTRRTPAQAQQEARAQAAPAAAAAVVAPVTAGQRVDKQNVHDHAVAQTTKKNVKDIVVQGDEYDRVELIDDVMSALRTTKLSEKVLTDAFRVLVSLVPDQIVSIGCSQLDVLHATKSKIDSVGNKTVKNNLVETLGKNLASGIERDHVVCSTGKIARIVSTLEGTDLVKNKSVPIEVVRREIASLASKIRQDILGKVSQEEIVAYNESSVSGLGAKMRTRFEQEADKIYVAGLGLSPEVLSPIKALYSSEF